MKFRIRASFILFVTLFLMSCAPKSLVTEPARAAWYANQVAIRVNELSKTIITLNAQGTVNDKDTRMFGVWAKSTLLTLKEVPNGWEKTVKTGWDEVKLKLPSELLNDPRIASIVLILDSLLTLLNPEQDHG